MQRFCSACGAQVSTPYCTTCGTPTGIGTTPSAVAPPGAAPPGAAPVSGASSAPPPPPLLPPADGGAPWGARRPQDPAAAQRRTAIIIGSVASLVLVGGAAWALTGGGGSAGREQDVAVDVTLYDEAYGEIDDDERCTGQDAGYDELGAGSPVVFRDSGGDVVGRARLGTGIVLGDGCEFSVETEVDLVSDYAIEIGGEFVESFDREEMEELDWELFLEIGESTEF